MAGKNKALHAGLGYTIGNIFIKGINFLTLPLFSRLMTMEEFGTYNIFISYDAILSIILGFATYTSVRSAHYEFKDTDKYVSSISLFYILNAIFFLALILVGGHHLASFLGFNESLLLLLVPFSFAGGIVQLYNQRISLNYDYKKYLIIAFINSFGNVVLSLIFILTVFDEERDIGRILGTVCTIFLISMVLLFDIFKKRFPKYNQRFWKFGLLYSLPIVPHGLSQVLLGQCDRIMISYMIGNSAAGIYSLAGNLQLVLAVITNSIGTSWSTWFYSKMEQKKYLDIQRNAELLSHVFLIFTIALLAISPEIIYVLGGDNYENGKFVAIPMLISGFLVFLYSVIVPSEYYTKQTIYIMFGTMIAAVINIIGNFIFIKIGGYIAAAYTTLFSYVCYLLLHVFISYKLVRFNVIRIKHIFLYFIVLFLSGGMNLFFINDLVLRYTLSFIVVILLTIPICKRLFLKVKK